MNTKIKIAKYLLSASLFLVSLGSAATITYQNIISEPKNWEKEIKNLENNIWGLFNEIKEEIKNYKEKKKLKKIWILLINLKMINKSFYIKDVFLEKKNFDKQKKSCEKKIEQMLKKINFENFENVYKKMQIFSDLISEAWNKDQELYKNIKNLSKKWTEDSKEIENLLNSENKNWKKIKEINLKISIILKNIITKKYYKFNENQENIKSLEEKISTRKNKIKNILKELKIENIYINKIENLFNTEYEVAKLLNFQTIISRFDNVTIQFFIEAI